MGRGCEGPVCGKNGAWGGGSRWAGHPGGTTDLREQMVGTAVVGGTSGVKGEGGDLRPYLMETVHCKRLEMLAEI